MSKPTSNFYRHLALKLSMKHDEHLSVTLGLLRCHLSFALLQSRAWEVVKGAPQPSQSLGRSNRGLRYGHPETQSFLLNW